MSPRRSSRARSSTTHSNSHQSSQSSRGSRHKRHDDKDDSLNNEDGLNDGDELMDDDVDDAGSGNEEDEGETRCVCGYKEYQGGSDDGSTDATDGLFIQCDQCKVWQHGLCVGIRDIALAPENYFCEMCKPSYHILYEKKGGKKHSTYVGTGDGSNDGSLPKDHPTKRRSTMNSRDAAYDEQVLLQRAIEESKTTDKKSGNPRGRKRGTSEGSEEGENKRQRTSNSPDKTATEAVESMDEKADKSSSSKKSRSSRVNNNNNNNTTTTTATSSSSTTTNGNNSSSNNNNNSSKRSSNRNRGRERGDSRREDSEQSEEHPRSTRNTQKAEDQVPSISTPTVDTPDTPSQPSKRNGRASNGRRRNRNARKVSEDPGDASSQAMTRDHSMAGDHSRNDNVIDKPAKPRLPHSRTTLQEMRKRVTGISDFITRTQFEMAEEKKRLFAFSAIVTATSPPASTPKIVADMAEQAPKMPALTSINGNAAERSSASSSSSASPPSGVPDVNINGLQVTVISEDPEKRIDVANLASTEIMDLLMRKVHQWECTYGRQGEKV